MPESGKTPETGNHIYHAFFRCRACLVTQQLCPGVPLRVFMSNASSMSYPVMTSSGYHTHNEQSPQDPPALVLRARPQSLTGGRGWSGAYVHGLTAVYFVLLSGVHITKTVAATPVSFLGLSTASENNLIKEPLQEK